MKKYLIFPFLSFLLLFASCQKDNKDYLINNHSMQLLNRGVVNIGDSSISNNIALYADSLGIWHNEYLSHIKVNLDNYTLVPFSSDFLDSLNSLSQRYFQSLGVI